MTVSVLAPAKVNLALHVTGQRADGYHLIDTLVGFGPAADVLTITDSATLSLTVTGREAAGVPDNVDNLVMQAAAILADGRGAAMTLEKRLPAASGIGGGSADAAAALRGLLAHWDRFDPDATSDDELAPIAAKVLELGADVPMCLLPCPVRARGIGERIELVHALPDLPAVLVNPRIAVSTPAVFAALENKENAPMPDPLPQWQGQAEFIDWLAGQRNDLQPAALSLHPGIGAALDILEAQEGCALVRMSGSGATCFALFAETAAARQATYRIHRAHPDWWVAGGVIGNQLQDATPRIS